MNADALNSDLEQRITDHGSRIAGLYAIVDSQWNPCATLAALAERYLEGECRLLQLRMKDVRDPGSGIRDPMRKEAEAIMRLKDRFDFTFIVNDHADLAREVGADGVHVGENDESVAAIRARHGAHLLIGYSSHSVDEARNAVDAGADYVAFGAIFPTKTKGPGHPVQGLDRLKALAASVDVPVVAIGGITRENVHAVVDAGADAVAMITALSQAQDMVEETKWFTREMAKW